MNSSLAKWSTLQNKCDWSGILIGNGASMAVWEKFQYESLYSKSKSAEVSNPLSEAHCALFDFMQTTNFEKVLSALSTANGVCDALHLDTSLINERYTSIQQALAEAVQAVHVPWNRVSTVVLDTIRSELLNYSFVYSTNYDLLVYWAIMHAEARGFKDFFFRGERFDISNTDVWDKSTLVLYLHGALQLYRLPTGETLKRRATETESLLDSFGNPYQEGAVPLFVSEGTSKDKLGSIYRSDYLSFSYAKFSHHEGNLVVFGHGLHDGDAHLVDAMRKWGKKAIAISMRRDSPAKIRQKKAALIAKLPEAQLFFFDAVTHPLGRRSLRVNDLAN